MRILFVGLMYNPEKEKEYLTHSKVGLGVASNLYELNLVKGLSSIDDVHINACGSIPYGNYPSLSDELFVPDSVETFDNIRMIEVGYINFYLVKHSIREQKIKKIIFDWNKKYEDEDKYVLFYDLYAPFINIIDWLKQFNKIRTCLIVPDLTGKLRNESNAKGLKNFVLNHQHHNYDDYSHADSYILFTEQMNSIINRRKKPYVVIDGIVSTNERRTRYLEHGTEEKVILYAGLLSHQYGLDLIIKAFNSTPEMNNFELWFCGKGDMEAYIEEESGKNHRIQYKGFLSKEELTKLESKVSFYINPRPNEGEYVKYSFPSKNLEYLLAGKPVIAYKLDGMSDEYDNNFIYIKEKNVEAIEDVFRKISKFSEIDINKIGKQNHDFVIRHNGNIRQAEKVVDMLKGLR